MGRPGCITVKYRAYSACASGKFTSGTRLGTVYGRGNSCSQCAGQTGCIHALGQTCTEQNSDADESETSDIKSAASKSVVGIQNQTNAFWEEQGMEPIDWQIENI